MRTVAVWIAGVILWFGLTVGFQRLLFPNSPQLIYRAMTTSPGSPEWRGTLLQMRHDAQIGTYLLDPLVAGVVGASAGFLQKRRAALLAASCLLPSFLYEFVSDHARLWAHSALGLLRYSVDSSLPFATAILAATVCHRLVSARRQHRTAPVPS